LSWSGKRKKGLKISQIFEGRGLKRKKVTTTLRVKKQSLAEREKIQDEERKELYLTGQRTQPQYLGRTQHRIKKPQDICLAPGEGGCFLRGPSKALSDRPGNGEYLFALRAERACKRGGGCTLKRSCL